MFLTIAVGSFGLLSYLLRIILQIYVIKFTVLDLSHFEKAHDIPNYQKPPIHTVQGVAAAGLVCLILVIFFRLVELWRAIEENQTYDDFLEQRMLSAFTPLFAVVYLVFDGYLAYSFWTLSQDLPSSTVATVCKYLFFGVVGLIVLVITSEIIPYVGICLLGAADAHQADNQGNNPGNNPQNNPQNNQNPQNERGFELQ
ncbi:hypothetical protein F5Y18DRAFT_432442 [Xylariaceae sp. FL1019]|nr:hypothetical protein F5Y18DRAFT_432442 [Xylariaceae sp. FL1019]